MPDSGCPAGQHFDGLICQLNITQIAVGYTHACALLSDETVMCWGANDSGELGDDSLDLHRSPVLVQNLTGVRSIAVGQHQTCAILTDGSLWCWGWNGHGQLGLGTIDDQHLPVPVPGMNDVSQVSIGNAHACAVLPDATVMCWGWNIRGAVGDGDFPDSLTPTPIAGLVDVDSVSAGDTHNCARLSDGSAVCWGHGDDGRLGDGLSVHQTCTYLTSTYDCSPVPVDVAGFNNDILSISAGGHSCLRTADGTPFCWAENEVGQLGDGTLDMQILAVPVQGIPPVDQIAAGSTSSCAFTTDGTVFCWGSNNEGQLGDGTAAHQDCAGTDCSPVPVSVTGLPYPATQVAVGSQSACAVVQDGSAWCWGRGDWGQLGDGMGEDSNTPVRLLHP